MNDDWTMFEFGKLDDKDIPSDPAVYILFHNDELVYVGQTKNLKQRIRNHNYILNSNNYIGNKKLDEDTFNCFFYVVIDNLAERRLLEKILYEAYEPKANFVGYYSNQLECGSLADYMKFRLEMGLEKRYEL